MLKIEEFMYINNQHKPQISLDLPYCVAAGIIKLAFGSTDLDSAINIKKYK